jgi:hypothetical protein
MIYYYDISLFFKAIFYMILWLNERKSDSQFIYIVWQLNNVVDDGNKGTLALHGTCILDSQRI